MHTVYAYIYMCILYRLSIYIYVFIYVDMYTPFIAMSQGA